MEGSSDKTATMPNPLDRRRLKDRIVENISKAVKQLQTSQMYTAPSEKAVLHNEDRRFHKLAEHLDHAFLHGLRHITDGYWMLAESCTHSSVVKQINCLTYVTSNLGRGRAWLYLALNDQLLESYLRCLCDSRKLVSKYYVREALLLDQQRLQIILTLASGLEHVQFALNVDVPYLDLSSHLRLRSVSEDVSMVPDAEDAVSLCSNESLDKSSDVHCGSVDSFSSACISGQQSLTSSMFTPCCPTSSHSIHRSISLPVADFNSSMLSSIDSSLSLNLNLDDGDLEVIHVKPRSQKGKKKKGQKKKECDLDSNELSVTPLPSTPESGYRSVVEALSTSEAELEVSGVKELPRMTSCDRLMPQGEEERTVVGSLSGCSERVKQVAATTRAQRGSPDGAPCFGASLSQQLVLSTNADEAEDESAAAAPSSNELTANDMPSLYTACSGTSETVDACLGESLSVDCPDAAAAASIDCSQSVSCHTPITLYAESLLQTAENVPIVPEKQSHNELEAADPFLSPDRDVMNSDTSDSEPPPADESEDCDSMLKWIVQVDNNTKLVLMLDVFQDQEEKFIKMFKTSVGWTEGDPEPVNVLLTSHGLYIMAPTERRGQGTAGRFHVHTHISYRELDYVSLGLGCQVINFVCANRRKQAWLTTGSQALTKIIMKQLDAAVRECELNLPHLSTLTDSTTQKISLKKWVAKETDAEPREVTLVSYCLTYWQDSRSLQSSSSMVPITRQGVLNYLAYNSLFSGAVWKEAFFVLKNGVFYQYDNHNESDGPPKLCIALNEECGGCRSTTLGRENSFEIIQADGSALQLSADTPKEAKDWITSLCRVVADGAQPNNGSGACIPCCAVITTSHLLLCHEELLTNFFRSLSKLALTDITGVMVDISYPTYCVLESSGQKGEERTGKWVLYFSRAAETDQFLASLKEAWMDHFKVELPSEQIWDVQLQERCREGATKLGRQL